MSKISEENSVVGITYRLTESGKDEVIDSNVGSEPLEFITGKGYIIPGLEKALVGMSEGESAKIEVPASEAYGEFNPDAIQTLPREQFEGIDLQEGMPLYGQDENGNTIQVTVRAFDENSVTIDPNHPLAGKDLIFDVTVAEVRDATEDEIATGQIGGGCTDGSCGCGH
jgi:FKBP-type peptidyl-prolyl cis-trans isomerase SlyD